MLSENPQVREALDNLATDLETLRREHEDVGYPGHTRLVEQCKAEVAKSELALLSTVASLVRQEEREKCDICTGTAKNLDGSPCLCGNGSLYGQVQGLRKRLFEERAKVQGLVEAWKEAATQTCPDCVYCGRHRQRGDTVV